VAYLGFGKGGHGERVMPPAVTNRKCKFLSKFIVSDNVLCNVFKDVAMKELLAIDSNTNY